MTGRALAQVPSVELPARVLVKMPWYVPPFRHRVSPGWTLPREPLRAVVRSHGVLVPLPTAAADHQTTNASALETAGAAIHIPQSQLDVERLDRIELDLPERGGVACVDAAHDRVDAVRVVVVDVEVDAR